MCAHTCMCTGMHTSMHRVHLCPHHQVYCSISPSGILFQRNQNTTKNCLCMLQTYSESSLSSYQLWNIFWDDILSKISECEGQVYSFHQNSKWNSVEKLFFWYKLWLKNLYQAHSFWHTEVSIFWYSISQSSVTPNTGINMYLFSHEWNKEGRM